MFSKTYSRCASLVWAIGVVALALTAAVATAQTSPSATPAPARPIADEAACRKAALKFLEDTIDGDVADDAMVLPADASHRKEFDAVRAYRTASKRLGEALEQSKYAAEIKAWRDRRAKEKAQATNSVRAANVVVSGDTARLEVRNVPPTTSPALQPPEAPRHDFTLVLVKKGERWLVDVDRSAKFTGNAYEIRKASDFAAAADAVTEDIGKDRVQSPFDPVDLFNKKLYRISFQRGFQDAIDEGVKKDTPSPSSPLKKPSLDPTHGVEPIGACRGGAW